MLTGDLEWVEDWDTRTSLAYSAERNVLIRHTEPDLFDPEHRIRGIDTPSALAGGLSVTDDLALLFEQARRGQGSLQMTRTVYVNREAFLPVRVLERVEGRTAMVTDYLLAERLPRTPANERLLRMSPHPGAKRITEGRL